jgi:PAP2 superfamily
MLTDGLGWIADALVVVGFYAAYTVVRNQLGSARVDYSVALQNAERVIDLERAVGIFREPAVQGWFLDHRAFLVACNAYYHVAHYIAPIAVLVFLRARHRDRLRKAEAVLFASMILALVGFAIFPLAPPRLVAGHGFVDTIHEPQSTWGTPAQKPAGSFKGYASNQFAAMPSVHFAWPVWAACMAVPLVRSRAIKALLLLHVLLTLIAVVATANHWFLDATAGAAVVLALVPLVWRVWKRG